MVSLTRPPFINHNKHKSLESDERDKIVKEARKKYWEIGYTESQIEAGSQPVLFTTEQRNTDGVEEDAFIRRSVPQNITPATDNENYIPEGALKLTIELWVEWDIRNEDLFVICYKDSASLLDGFMADLMSSGMETNLIYICVCSFTIYYCVLKLHLHVIWKVNSLFFSCDKL